MNLKRTMALVLSVVMIFAVFAGCGRKDVTTSVGTITAEEQKEFEKLSGGIKLPIDTNGTEITIFTPSSNINLTDTVVVKELSRRTGINVQIREVTTSTAAQKFQTLLAAKESLPDIVTTGFKVPEINDLGQQGAFVNVLDYTDELPNMKRIFIDEVDKFNTLTVIRNNKAPDGNLYFFPSYAGANIVQHGMLYRKDIFDKHGIKMWNNPEEFYQVLKKLKELYPDSYPLTSKTGVTFFGNLGMMWGVGGFPYHSYVERTGKWDYTIFTDEFKEALAFTKKLYDEKLLDPEFLTLTQAAWTSKMTQADKSFVTYDWIGRLDQFTSQSTVEGYDLRYGNPMGPTQKIKARGIAGIKGPVKKSEKSLIALKLLDYLLSEGGAELVELGVEGESFEWTDAEHTDVKYLLDEGEVADEDTVERKWGISMVGLSMRSDSRSWRYNFTEREQEAQDIMNNMPGGGFYEDQPNILLTTEEKEFIQAHTSEIEKASQEFATQYILNGKTSQADWDAFTKKVKLLGYDKIVKYYNDAQARYNAEFGKK